MRECNGYQIIMYMKTSLCNYVIMCNILFTYFVLFLIEHFILLLF